MKIFLMLLVLIVSCSGDDSAPPGHLSRNDALADFQFLVKRIQEIHPNLYIHKTAADEAALIKKLRAELDASVDTVGLYNIAAEYLTSFKDGHTFPAMDFVAREYQSSLDKGNTIMPIEVDFNDGEFFIERLFNDGKLSITGAKLAAINGKSAEQIISAFQRYYAKAVSRFDAAHARLFREYFYMSFGSYERWAISYQPSHGKVKEIELPGLDRATFDRLNNVTMNQQSEMGGPGYDFRYLEEGQIGLLTMTRMGGLDAFKIWLEKIFGELQQRQTPYLVIDMRKNGGGSSALGDALFDYLNDQPYGDGRMYVKISEPIQQWYINSRQGHPLYNFVVDSPRDSLVMWPDTAKIQPGSNKLRYNGKSFLLIGPKTFSSGHMFAGLFKCQDIGTVIGQPTGQATRTVGDAFFFRLPKSRIGVNASYKVFESDCEANYLKGFQPDIYVSYDAEELQAGDDKELAVVRRLIEEGGSQ